MPKYLKTRDCPRCHSKKTGFVLFVSNDNTDRLIGTYLKKGQLVEPRIGATPRIDLCKCFHCGLEWEENMEKVKITPEELNTIKEEKGITKEKIDQMVNQKKYSKQFLKRKKEDERIEKGKGILKNFFSNIDFNRKKIKVSTKKLDSDIEEINQRLEEMGADIYDDDNDNWD